MPLPAFHHVIDGALVGEPDRISRSPADGAELGAYADGGATEATAAIDAARRAFDRSAWSHDRHLRHRVLCRIADRLEARADEIARALARENGKRRVDRILTDAERDPAVDVIVRGGQRGGPDSAFVAPALLAPHHVGHRIVQEEIFGPVATFETFDTEDESVALANATQYGLSASVWSRDVDRPPRVARRVRAGTVWINGWAIVADQFEEGGFNQSGLGRLNGPAALLEFQEVKTYVQSVGGS